MGFMITLGQQDSKTIYHCLVVFMWIGEAELLQLKFSKPNVKISKLSPLKKKKNSFSKKKKSVLNHNI